MAERIGFIGLGIMGEPMCRNLMKAGYACTVNTRTKSRAGQLLSEGAVWADSPEETAGKSDVIITIVTDTPDVEKVILGEGGIIEGISPGSVVIDMSTISPSATRTMAAALREKGADMLDAPVSGGDTGAIAGTLSIMVGGRQEVFERCLPVFEAMGKSINLIGDHGAGQMTKLCNQVAVSVTNLAMAEALILAAKAGLDMEKMLAAISGGAAGSWQLSNLAPRIIKRDFDPGFMVKLQQKDLRLVLGAASELGLGLPGASLAHQLFNAVEAAGEGDEGTQALVKSLERMSGVEVHG
ncbi:MAG: NAD-binding protein [Gemmatimonadetes bacterium]|nr:NAD-binding protein [Gemmatimonadota bacterium]MYD25851.1 NAD-binding protein [Gemmatimonadota bacterium]MYJ00587.1 NAD-binding protein [Gemmatimonadota bacterium]